MNSALFGSLLGGSVAPLVGGEVRNFVGQAGVPGNTDGIGLSATITNATYDISVASDGTLYMAIGNNNIVRKILPDGTVSLFAGQLNVSGSADGTGASATFNLPRGSVVNSSGNVQVTEAALQTIRSITPGAVVTTRTLSPATPGSWITADNSGNVYIVRNDRAIYTVSPSNVVTLLAGNFSVGGFADNTGSSARFEQITGIHYCPVANVIYVVDIGNSRLRQVTLAGVVTTVFGDGIGAYTNGAVASARLSGNAYGVTTGPDGAIYLCESHTIRKVSGGNVSTFAGNKDFTGYVEDIGSAARFSFCKGIVYSSFDNCLFVVDQLGTTIRKVGI